MAGMGIMAGYVHPHIHPRTQLKKSGIPHTHTHTQSMRRFPILIPNQCGDSPSKRGRVRVIPTGTSLFVISNRVTSYYNYFVKSINCTIFDINLIYYT